MQDLAPSARGVLTAVQALSPAWTGLQQEVQGRFFRGIGQDISALGETFLPVLRENLVDTAGILNSTIRGFTEWATEGERVRPLDAILGGLNSQLERIQIGRASCRERGCQYG